MAGTGSGLTQTDAEFLFLCDDNGTFLRRIANGIIANFALDGVTPYTPVGSVVTCTSTSDAGCGGVLTIELCDDNGRFLKHIVRDCEGAVAGTITTEIDGTTSYVTSGTVRQCESAFDTVSAQIRNLSGGTWTIADVTGGLISLAVVVVAGASDNEIDVGDVPITNVPTGFGATWGVESDGQILDNANSIDPGTGGRIIVSWTETG